MSGDLLKDGSVGSLSNGPIKSADEVLICYWLSGRVPEAIGLPFRQVFVETLNCAPRIGPNVHSKGIKGSL